MEPNEIKAEAFEKKPVIGSEKAEAYEKKPVIGSEKAEAYEKKPVIGSEKAGCMDKGIDMCKLQYYCPQPIIGARLAHAYVPFQFLCCLYNPEKGLQQGTIFPELDRPYGTDPEYLFDA